MLHLLGITPPPPRAPCLELQPDLHLKVVIILLVQMLQMLAGRDPTMLHMLGINPESLKVQAARHKKAQDWAGMTAAGGGGVLGGGGSLGLGWGGGGSGCVGVGSLSLLVMGGGGGNGMCVSGVWVEGVERAEVERGGGSVASGATQEGTGLGSNHSSRYVIIEPSWRTCTCTHPTVQSVLVWVLAGVSKVWLAIYSIEAAQSSGWPSALPSTCWPALGQDCHAHCEEGLRLLLGVVKGQKSVVAVLICSARQCGIE